jgi:hypothetical protein
MTSSATSSIRQVLEGYIAGRLKAERVVAAVAEAYYREGAAGRREAWRPVMDVIERAHPGIVELTGSAEGPGFAVRLTQRPFPREYEPALKLAAEQALPRLEGVERGGEGEGGGTRPSGFVGRLVNAMRRLFSASA